jgi:bacterioferritin
MSILFNKILKNKNTLLQAKNLQEENEKTKHKQKFIELLQAAYCDEWIAVYQYSIEADYLNKLNYQSKISDKVYNQITKELNLHTQEEFNHAKLIVPELIVLGSEPIYQISKLESTANAPLLIPEKDHMNILFQALEAEEQAIKTYKTILDLVEDTKICSKKFQDTLNFILDEEYGHRNDLDKLIYELDK